MQFSDTTNRTGIIENIEDKTGTQSATDSTYPLATKTRDVNTAFDEYKSIVIDSCGTWQEDDTNQTDYPILTFDVVSGQDNYAFTNDGSTPANQILGLYKLRIKSSAGIYYDIDQIDRVTDDINQYQFSTGVPQKYDITSNGIILYPTPNYNYTNGLEAYVSRTPSYFSSTDTTKKPGIPNLFHMWLVLHPAYYWCLTNLPNLAPGYYRALYGVDGNGGMKAAIKKYYSNRNAGQRLVMTAEEVNSL